MTSPRSWRAILARLNNPASPLWGGNGVAHYWGEPLFGYYRGDDPWVLRRHAQMLADAGMDVLIFDTTNAAIVSRMFISPLCEVFARVRQAGGRTPQIAFMVNTKAGETATESITIFTKRISIPNCGFSGRASR